MKLRADVGNECDLANDNGTGGGVAAVEPKFKDNLSQRGAMDLARRLERYWHSRGFPAARFWAELIDDRFAKIGTYEIYRVCCNLVNGLPPVYRDDTLAPRR